MTTTPALPRAGGIGELREAYRLRWIRRRLLWRAFRSRHQLTALANRTTIIRPGDILCISTMRNEMDRLPHFLAHNRRIGIAHFLVVDNSSDDGTAGFLSDQPDVSLWSTPASYKSARFGVDWLTWLQMRHGHGHWCLSVDADELLVYPNWTERNLGELARWLDEQGVEAFGALMLDLYPRGPLSGARFTAGTDPLKLLRHFDPAPHRIRRKQPEWNLWVQGGVRDRMFFAEQPERAPTLNKLPFVRWNRRFTYRNSTHSILPRRLNLAYDGPGSDQTSGVLLHTKFLPIVTERASKEKARREHFGASGRFDSYYDSVASGPDLWCEASVEYRGWQQLVGLGLITQGNWT